jgi:hypothetical protein
VQTNPFARRKRLRLVTASLGAAAALGGATPGWSSAPTASDDRFAASVQTLATSSGSVRLSG